jgi:hypothetical protein
MSSDADKIAELQQMLADKGEESADLHLQAEEAKRLLGLAQKWRDPAQLDALVLDVARDIEDLFARGYEGGRFSTGTIGPVEMRRNAIVTRVRRAVDEALIGGKPDFV